ncbi:tyrosyl-DNA phosphodiesterase-domain-containing protein [Myxozyma melibiosi]|uniref:Tyrosyl-DNA phosphodiesterase-domain-containing protein n=1 Tax=Myxozyma melibiosi TaxID=54550 RepID=A0ABR1FA82_9ASCO
MEIVDLSSDSPSPVDEDHRTNDTDIIALDDSQLDADLKLEQEHQPPESLSSSSSSYLASLDRAAMERERLLRISRANGGGRPKRRREDSDDEVEMGNGNDGDQDTVSHESDSLGRGSTTEMKRQREDTADQIPFPRGVVKRTAVTGYPRTGDEISIEEVLQPRHLRSAVLSAFQWDFDWILNKIFIGRTSLVLVVPAKGSEVRDSLRKSLGQVPNARLCMPNMDGMINCMHSKLQILFYDKYVRIAVPSANLTDYDWGEGMGVIENYVYIHDFPLRSSAGGGSRLPSFAADLIYFLEAQGMHQDIIDRLETEVSWEGTENVEFVHSIGGEHRGEKDIWRTGFTGLTRAIQKFGGKGSEVQIDYVISSLGSLTPVFVENIYNAASGKYYSIVTPPKSVRSVLKTAKERLRVYFPTHDTVAASRGGTDSAGTICFSANYYEKPVFPREILRDGRCTRRGCLMHEKVMLIRFDEPVRARDGVEVCGAAYVGSANMSESAW